MKFDSQLHILRSIAASIEDARQRQEAQSARFNLYAALEMNDDAEAGNWLEALEAALACAAIPNAHLRATAERAILAIRKGLA